MNAVKSAYFDFSNQHGEVEVLMTQNVEDILQAMLNRSDEVDIYSLYVGSSQYDAVFNRGYMADLSQSQALTDLAKSFYPFVQDALFKDGQLVAIPTDMSAYCRFYNTQAMEKLGVDLGGYAENLAGIFRVFAGSPAGAFGRTSGRGCV